MRFLVVSHSTECLNVPASVVYGDVRQETRSHGGKVAKHSHLRLLSIGITDKLVILD